MLITNYKDYEKACKERGWDATAYQKEIETYIDSLGGAIQDVNYYGEFADSFYLKKQPVLRFYRNDEEKRLSLSECDFDALENDGWEYFDVAEDAEYEFVAG